MNRNKAREYQLSQLWLLEEFDAITKKLGLQYYIVYGTLLGAIRNKQFIPWDADIAVAMHRDDYEKLRKYFFSQPIDYLFYDHYETEGFHTSPHAILRIKGTHVYFKGARSCKYASSCDGIYIDIFPIDSLINDEKKAQKQMKEFNIIERLIILKSALAYGEKTSPIKIILKKVISDFLWFISFKSLNQRLDNIMKRYHSEKTTNVIIMILPDIKKNIFPRACFQEPKILDFEGKKFPAPTRPEEFLTIHYSDYMTCPHEKERWDYIDNFIEDVDFGNYPPLIKFIKEKRLGE